MVGQVLLGWMEVPPTMDQPLTFVINPVGATARGELRVWNNGDQRLKLVPLHLKGPPPFPRALRRGKGGGGGRGVSTTKSCPVWCLHANLTG